MDLRKKRRRPSSVALTPRLAPRLAPRIAQILIITVALTLTLALGGGCAKYRLVGTPTPLSEGYYAIGSISSSLEDIKYQINFNRQVSDFLAQFNIYPQSIDSLYIVDSMLYSLETTSILKNNFGNAEISQISLQVVFSVTPSNRNQQGAIILRKFTKTYESKAFYNIDSSVVQTNTNSLDAFRRALEDILFDFRIDLINHALSVEKSIDELKAPVNKMNDTTVIHYNSTSNDAPAPVMENTPLDETPNTTEQRQANP